MSFRGAAGPEERSRREPVLPILTPRLRKHGAVWPRVPWQEGNITQFIFKQQYRKKMQLYKQDYYYYFSQWFAVAWSLGSA